MAVGGQSGDALTFSYPIPVCWVSSQGDALIFLVKFWGREGRQCSLQGLGEDMRRERAAVSSNPAGKAGRGLKGQLTCLHWRW